MAREPSSSEDKTWRLRGLRRKLARRNRQPMPAADPSAAPAPVKPPDQREAAESEAVVYRRDLPLVQPPRVPEGGGICIPLERCVTGAEAACPQGEPFYLIERTPDQWGEAALGLADKLQQALHRLPARRLYRQRLLDCKLQTLERYVCGRQRGHDMPRAYHDFVRTGDAREMAQIIEHNLHDLVTMVHLLIRMAGESRPEA